MVSGKEISKLAMQNRENKKNPVNATEYPTRSVGLHINQDY